MSANKGATAAPARLKGDTARSGSIPCKHKGHLQPSSPTSGLQALMVILGSSMLAGKGCTETKANSTIIGRECADPRRLIDSLVRSLYEAAAPTDGVAACDGSAHAVDYVNLATGGSTTTGTLSVLPALVVPLLGGALPMPTLLLLDFSINDLFDAPGATLLPSLESMVRYLLRAFPATAIVLVESYPGTGWRADQMQSKRA
ncbi:hypothetical protein T492DRAFT_875918 [Pavlovales sp. CCMP2436]|nr:hypothetical protein T492DRAFT_875918 [Pavlovales sp. CCMP2436]